MYLAAAASWRVGSGVAQAEPGIATQEVVEVRTKESVSIGRLDLYNGRRLLYWFLVCGLLKP